MRTTAFALLLAIAFPAQVLADTDKRDFSVHAGLGLAVGSTQLSVSGTSGNTSSYLSQGYVLESGVSIPMSSAFGLFASGELGQMSAANSSNGSSFLEVGTQTILAPKAGFYAGPLYFGAGYRVTNLTVRSIVAGRNSYQETTFTGGLPMGIAGFAFEARKRYRAAIEFQYVTGTLPGSGTTTPSLSYSEITVGLRFFGLFD